jgi:metal-responsive CopG/Arc/MetJ family transcriptional regulator
MGTPRNTKILGFSVLPEIAKEFEDLCERKNYTKSELFRAMFRTYKDVEALRERENENQLRLLLYGNDKQPT